jgi:hypothetical protein
MTKWTSSPFTDTSIDDSSVVASGRGCDAAAMTRVLVAAAAVARENGCSWDPHAAARVTAVASPANRLAW